MLSRKRFRSHNLLSSAEPSFIVQLSRWRVHLGFLLGPVLFLFLLWIGPQGDISPPAWAALALTVLMAVWWVTEALPIAITALLPVALLPLLDVRPIEEAAAPYANPLIFLFLGGFILAEAIQRWGLHRRLSLLVLSVSGTRPDRVVAGFMIATAGLSMWVSNTATAALMLPIALSVLNLVDSGTPEKGHQNLGLCLLLGIAAAANIGGMATIIGTPPNAILAGYLSDNHNIQISFGEWMMFAFPLSMILLTTAWMILTRVVYPLEKKELSGVGVMLDQERGELGAMKGPEKAVATIFCAVALAWLTRPLVEAQFPGLGLSDAGIAILGALLFFVVPAEWKRLQFLMDWESARRLPWGVLLLVGGGLSLGSAIESSGLAGHAADALHALAGLPIWLIMAGVIVMIMALSHVTSNTATAATMLPLTSSLALSLELPLLYLTIPVAMAASCAFMLPVATPPNAIVFSSNRLTVMQMARSGAVISLLTVPLILFWVRGIMAPYFG